MKSTLLHESEARTYALIFETGDEVMAELRAFAAAHAIDAAQFTAIGAFRDVTLGYFQSELKDYQTQRFDEQVEVLAMMGDLTDENGKPNAHAHVVLGRPDFSAIGGHLFEGHVRPTLEVILVESPAHLRRRFDPDSGLALISLEH